MYYSIVCVTEASHKKNYVFLFFCLCVYTYTQKGAHTFKLLVRAPYCVIVSVYVEVNEDVGRSIVVIILADVCFQASTKEPFLAGVVSADFHFCGAAIRIKQVDAIHILGFVIELVAESFVAPRSAWIIYGVFIDLSVNHDVCVRNVAAIMPRSDVRVTHLSEEVIEGSSGIGHFDIISDALDFVIGEARCLYDSC